MSNKIISITERVPQVATIPDGIYTGTWGRKIIEVTYLGKVYNLKTEEGVRGMGIRVMVCIKEGVATFEELKN